jgi:hypothetical protein
MKCLIWTITVLALGLWTLLMSLVAGVAAWLAAQSGKVLPDLGQGVELMWPTWLTEWLPAVWLDPIREWVETQWAAFLEHWPQAASTIADVLSWVSPLAWTLWAIVTVLCLLLATGLHL